MSTHRPAAWCTSLRWLPGCLAGEVLLGSSTTVPLRRGHGERELESAARRTNARTRHIRYTHMQYKLVPSTV